MSSTRSAHLSSARYITSAVSSSLLHPLTLAGARPHRIMKDKYNFHASAFIAFRPRHCTTGEILVKDAVSICDSIRFKHSESVINAANCAKETFSIAFDGWTSLRSVVHDFPGRLPFEE